MPDIPKHHREVMNFLRDEYGIKDLVLEPGGKHIKLKFEYQGKQLIHLLAHTPPTDFHAKHNNVAHFRRVLGPPPEVDRPTPRKLEDMMPDVIDPNTLPPTAASAAPKETHQPPVSRSWDMTMACYNGGRAGYAQLWFLGSDELQQAFPAMLGVERYDDESWRIYADPRGRRKFVRYDNKWKLVFSTNDETPFGATPVEGLQKGNSIFIHLPKAERREIKAKHFQPFPVLSTLSSSSSSTPAKTPTLTLEHDGDPMTEMRQIVQRVKELEALSPYRLVRLESGRIVWRAPTIE